MEHGVTVAGSLVVIHRLCLGIRSLAAELPTSPSWLLSRLGHPHCLATSKLIPFPVSGTPPGLVSLTLAWLSRCLGLRVDLAGPRCLP